jgi:hypothetical protein
MLCVDISSNRLRHSGARSLANKQVLQPRDRLSIIGLTLNVPIRRMGREPELPRLQPCGGTAPRPTGKRLQNVSKRGKQPSVENVQLRLRGLRGEATELCATGFKGLGLLDPFYRLGLHLTLTRDPTHYLDELQQILSLPIV